MMQQHGFVRNILYKTLFEEFFISAIVSILGIRFFLKITGYPQLGGGGFHISHMLWGGLMLMIALMLILFFLNAEFRHPAAIIGGLGFGTFIDELGKFITSDNNYFYQPTIALIYVIFVLLYLSVHLLDRAREFTQHEHLINSIEIMKEAVINDLDHVEKEQAMYYLSKADPKDPITISMKKLYQTLDSLPRRKLSIWTSARHMVHKMYIHITQTRWFTRFVISIFFLQAIASIGMILYIIVGQNIFSHTDLIVERYFTAGTTAVFSIIQLCASATSLLFTIIGLSLVYRSRFKAYVMFKRSVLVSILLGQVFEFYNDPVSAFFGLILSIALLTGLNYLIEHEHNHKAHLLPTT